MRKILALILVVFLCSFAGLGQAAEATTAGAACSGNLSRADWDAIFQCVGSVWKRAALWVGASSDTCDSNHGGIIQWTGSAFKACNGSTWTTLGGAGGNFYGLQSVTGIKRSNYAYSSTLQFNSATSQTVSVTGQGSPLLSVSGGSWVSSATISQNQTVQVRLTAAPTDSTTYTVTFTTGTDIQTWSVTTAPTSAYLANGGSNHFLTDCAAAGGTLVYPGQLNYYACQFPADCISGWTGTGWRYYTGNFCRQGGNLYCAGTNDCTSPTGWSGSALYCQYCYRSCEVNCLCGCSYPTCYSTAVNSWCY